MKFRLLPDDILVGLSAILFFGAHMATQFYRGYLFETAAVAQQAADIIAVTEQAPILRYLLQMQQMSLIFGLLVPVFLIGTYVLIRQRMGPKYPWLRMYTALTFFMVAFIDFTNDFAFIAGLLLQGRI